MLPEERLWLFELLRLWSNFLPYKFLQSRVHCHDVVQPLTHQLTAASQAGQASQAHSQYWQTLAATPCSPRADSSPAACKSPARPWEHDFAAVNSLFSSATAPSWWGRVAWTGAAWLARQWQRTSHSRWRCRPCLHSGNRRQTLAACHHTHNSAQNLHIIFLSLLYSK